MSKRIGIVILNYKTYIDTEKLVNEILSQQSSYELHIQVVDNASPNESYEYLKERFSHVSNVDVYYNPTNSGFARGNNVGLRLLKDCHVDYALVLNNDIHFDLSLLDKLIKAYTTLDNCGIVSPIQKLPNGENERFLSLLQPTFITDILSYTHLLNRGKKWWQYKENTSYERIQETPIIPGCFIFIDYRLFEQIGFFDESTFLFCEERFLSKNLYDLGKKNYILLDCSYIHDHSKTIRQEISILNQKKLLHDGHIAYTKKYRSLPLLKVLLLEIMWQYYKLGFYIKLCVKKLLK